MIKFKCKCKLFMSCHEDIRHCRHYLRNKLQIQKGEIRTFTKALATCRKEVQKTKQQLGAL